MTNYNLQLASKNDITAGVTYYKERNGSFVIPRITNITVISIDGNNCDVILGSGTVTKTLDEIF